MDEAINHNRRRLLGRAAMTMAAAQFGLLGRLRAEDASASEPRQLASLSRATAWLNSPPLSPADLLERVVLVQFGTYTCISCAERSTADPGSRTPDPGVELKLEPVAQFARAPRGPNRPASLRGHTYPR